MVQNLLGKRLNLRRRVSVYIHSVDRLSDKGILEKCKTRLSSSSPVHKAPKKRIAAAKTVMKDKGIAEEELIKDPLITEAKKKTFEELCEYIREWQKELGLTIDPVESWMQIFLPQHHDIKDVSYYEKIGISWKTDNVNFIYHSDRVFRFVSMFELHLANEELWKNYTKLKQIMLIHRGCI